MKKKTFYSAIKSFDEDNGTISGYFSTYDRIPDSYGDIVAPGAFTETIKAREESGHPFPICFNHDLNQIVGKSDTIEDTEKGPLLTASFFNTQLGQDVRELVKSGCVFQFSFAYRVLDWAPVELEDGTKANELRKLELFEISIVPIPANPRAEVTDVKSGRRNSQKDSDALHEAIDLIQKGVDAIHTVLNESDEPDAEEEDKPNDEKSEEAKALNAKKAEILTFINENMED